MQLFISWSGDRSKLVASAFKDWIGSVIQEVETFMSDDDITKGSRWSAEISKRLEEVSEGVICVTPENLDSRWLNFEAGALAKISKEASVRTLLLGLSPSAVSGPLAEFQTTVVSDKNDVLKLVESINLKCDRPLSTGVLERTFDMFWDSFNDSIKAIPEPNKSSESEPRARSSSELLEETLERIRALERTTESIAYFVRHSSDSELARASQGARLAEDRFPAMSASEIARQSGGLSKREELYSLLKKMNVQTRDGRIGRITRRLDEDMVTVTFSDGETSIERLFDLDPSAKDLDTPNYPKRRLNKGTT